MARTTRAGDEDAHDGDDLSKLERACDRKNSTLPRASALLARVAQKAGQSERVAGTLARMAAARPSFTFTRERAGTHERWTVADALGKLALRGRLPGAFGFDRATEALNRARAAGVATGDLLALAFPTSWLVNSAIPSPVLAKWHLPPFVGYFRALIGQLEIGPRALRDLEEARITSAVTPLAIDGQGAGARC